jgi:hypothetical protein
MILRVMPKGLSIIYQGLILDPPFSSVIMDWHIFSGDAKGPLTNLSGVDLKSHIF